MEKSHTFWINGKNYTFFGKNILNINKIYYLCRQYNNKKNIIFPKRN